MERFIDWLGCVVFIICVYFIYKIIGFELSVIVLLAMIYFEMPKRKESD